MSSLLTTTISEAWFRCWLRQPGTACGRQPTDVRGVEAVAEQRPDLVVLDVEMPVLTGPEMAYEMFIRNCGVEKIPIILTSGVVGLDEVAEMVGTRYFLAKPYDSNALLKLIDRTLHERVPPRPKLELPR